MIPSRPRGRHPIAWSDPEPAIARGTTLLRRCGAEPGERVVVLLGNDLATFGVLAAACLAGIVAVPLPPDLGADELTTVLTDAAPVAIVFDPAIAGAVSALDAAEVERAGIRLLPSDPHHLGGLPPTDPGADHPRTRPMAYTSGTTGRRKGVYVGIHDPAWGAEWITDEHAAFEHRHGDRHLVVSPLYHSGPFRFALTTALTGGRIAVLPAFSGGGLATALRALRPTSVFSVPTHLHRLLAEPGVASEALASLTLLAHAGAPCPVPLKSRLLEMAPDGAVWEFYGSTEGQFTVCPPGSWVSAPGTVGTARPGVQLEIRDHDGTTVGPGLVGTVWARPPAYARFAYWEDPERTADAWHDGRFTVGDLGSLDDAGRLWLAGRPGDLVITGGVNVYPAEVERELLELAGVAEAIVFGVPDEERGQSLVAAVVAWPGAALDPASLRATLRDRLPRSRIPYRIVVTGELPRTATGKVRRQPSALAALLELPDHASSSATGSPPA